MRDLPQKLSEFIENLSAFENENERNEILVDYADKFKSVPPEIAEKPYPEKNKIAFCESGAYVWTVMQTDKTPRFYFAVENPHGISAKALSVILDKTLSGVQPEEIIKISPDIVNEIFGNSLSMGKNLGLTGILLAMQRDVKNYLREHQNS